MVKRARATLACTSRPAISILLPRQKSRAGGLVTEEAGRPDAFVGQITVSLASADGPWLAVLLVIAGAALSPGLRPNH